MTTEPPLVDLKQRHEKRRESPRFTGWIVGAFLVGLAAFTLTAAWWNYRRPENCYRRGLRALEAGDRQTTVRESRRLIRTPGYEPYGRMLAGLLLIRENQMAEALPELQFAAQIEALAVPALTAGAQCYYALGRYIEAIDLARRVLARDENALDARRWLAAAYYDLGVTGEAVKELAIIAEKAPHDPRPERLLGLIDKDNEQFTDAVEHFRESLRRDPRQPERGEVLLELAESLVKLSHFDEAQEVLSECDRSPPALTLAAECEQSLVRIDEALENLREALELDPLYFPAKLKRGTLLLLVRRVDEAIVALEDAVRQAPYSSQAHFLLAQAYTRRGDRNKADVQLRLQKETEKVEHEFSKLHETASQEPSNPDVRVRLGELAIQLGKPELARLWFRSALAIKPDHPAALAGLAAIDVSNANE